MANAKEILNRKKSIQDTMKITNAMYMMSSMKLRKARQQLENTEPFFYGLQERISSILVHYPNIQHLYFDNRQKDLAEATKKKGYIVITGDKGMAGAYNHNILKEAQSKIDTTGDYHLFVVGELGRHYFNTLHENVDENFVYSASNPSIHRARVITEYIMDLYNREQLDEVYIIYTRMVNSMKENVEVEQLLPLKTHDFLMKQISDGTPTFYGQPSLEEADKWVMIYPSPKTILEKLAYNYITGFIYSALVESFASEENARMQAMQSATESAEKILHELSIQYNRIRQAAITQEITEVISGAKALKKKKKKQAR